MNIFKQMQTQRKLKKKIQTTVGICQQIYRDIPSFHLAKQARSEQQLFSYEYIYGEIDFTTLAQLLSHCKISPSSIFYDLGSGCGKVVIFSALMYELKQISGIEQLKLLHECAQDASIRSGIQNVTFHHADLLEYNWFDADIIFVNAATYIGDFWKKVLDRLKLLRPETQIIIVGKKLPDQSFELLYDDFLPMSWGITRVGIYKVL